MITQLFRKTKILALGPSPNSVEWKRTLENDPFCCRFTIIVKPHRSEKGVRIPDIFSPG